MIDAAGADQVLGSDALAVHGGEAPTAGTAQNDLLILVFHGYAGWTRHDCMALLRTGRPILVEVRHERSSVIPFAPDRF